MGSYAERLLAGLLGVAVVLPDGAPAPAGPAVRVGEHEHARRRAELTVQARRASPANEAEYRTGSVPSTSPADGQVDQAVAVAGQQHRRGRRGSARKMPTGSLDREHRDLRPGRAGRAGRPARARPAAGASGRARSRRCRRTSPPGGRRAPSRNRAHVWRGRARLYRSYCRSSRSAMSPTPMKRAIGAMASGSSVSSWRRPSKAFSRSAEGGVP